MQRRRCREASLPFNSFIMANVDHPWPPVREIAGILLVLLEFSAIPMRAAVAVCIILHFVLRSNGAGIRAPGLHLYWIDVEDLHSHIRLVLSILLTCLYLALAPVAWVCMRQTEGRRGAAKWPGRETPCFSDNCAGYTPVFPARQLNPGRGAAGSL
jgi:hypothetical protein